MQQRIDKTLGKARYSFDSLLQLVKYIDETPKTWGGASSSTRDDRGYKWDLDLGWQGSLEYARNGWLEGAQRAQKNLKAFTPNFPAPELRNDFYGHMPHVPRYCAGAPDNMIRHHLQPTHGAGKVVVLYVPVNANMNVAASQMANFGLAVAHYVNQLETDGVRVELHGAVCSHVSGWQVAHTWKIKGADQPLDLAVLAFSIGHPAMFRRLGFALRERCAAPRDYGYGEARRMRLDDIIDAPRNAYVLNGMLTADRFAPTPERALEYVEKEIQKAIDAQAEGVI